MSEPVRTPSPGAVRREQVLRAALDVIAERGFTETRIADVAARAGVSPALLVYYFKTKDALLTEAMRLGEESWYEAVAARMRERPNAIGRLEEILALSCSLTDVGDFPEPWSLWLDLWAQSSHDPAVANVRREFDEHWRKTIRLLVEEGVRAGEFRAVDADEFAVALSALLDGFAVLFALEDPSIDPERAFRLAMRFSAASLGFEAAPKPPN